MKPHRFIDSEFNGFCATCEKPLLEGEHFWVGKGQGHVSVSPLPVRGIIRIPEARREAMSDKLLNLVVNAALITLIVVGIVKLLKWAF